MAAAIGMNMAQRIDRNDVAGIRPDATADIGAEGECASAGVSTARSAACDAMIHPVTSLFAANPPAHPKVERDRDGEYSRMEDYSN